jgi:hypothetical protein
LGRLQLRRARLIQVLQRQPADQANGGQAAQGLQPPAAVIGGFASEVLALLAAAVQTGRCSGWPEALCGFGARMGQDLRRAGVTRAGVLRAGLAVQVDQGIGPLGVLRCVHAVTSMAWRSLARA